MRYLSAQFIAYFENGLWKQNATHANAQAQKLRQCITAVLGDVFTQRTDCNILLLKLPRPVADRLAQTTFFYYWNEAEDEIRLVTSWDTTDEDIEAVIEALGKD
jgi:threonine aldolase